MSARRESSHERHLLAIALLGPLPAVLGVLVLLHQAALPLYLAWSIAGAAVSLWLWSALSIQSHVARALANVANLLAALRQGDFSVRGHKSGGKDALGATLTEINGLADALARQRTEALEASALLAKVIVHSPGGNWTGCPTQCSAATGSARRTSTGCGGGSGPGRGPDELAGAGRLGVQLT